MGSRCSPARLIKTSCHFPDDFGEFLGYLWRYSTEHEMSDEEIQTQFDLLSEWQKATEVNRPKGIWEGILS